MRVLHQGLGSYEAKARRSILHEFVAMLLAILMICPPLQAQQGVARVAPSDLAAQNNSRVAASAAQVREVLQKDPGLMVELKGWVAKEATERGQIVNDSDLTDQAIYDRLAIDSEFRSVATRLLQRYGYLLPKLNPESDAAKEEELVRQARAQRIAKRIDEKDTEEALRTQTRRTRLDRRSAQELAEDQETQDRSSLPRERRQEQDNVSPPDGLPDGIPLDLQDKAALRQAARNPTDESGISPSRLAQTGRDSDLSYLPLLRRSTDTLLSATSGTALAEESRLARPEMPLGAGLAPYSTAEVRPSFPESRSYRGHARASELRRGERERSGEELSPYVPRPSPYADIPSLYDMYRQVRTQPGELRRFGADVFRPDAQYSEALPMDLPVGPDYVVGPGDGLAIDLWGSVSQRLYRTVDREGRLALPEVGPVLVSGRTLGEVQQALQKILRTQFRDVSADVSLSRLRAVRVYVVGDVKEPGAYDVSSLSTPLNALFGAGGPTDRGSLRLLRHYRGKQLVQEVDVYDLLLRGVRSDIQRLENGDTVLVPPVGAKVTVEGAVRRPAIYELRTEKTLADVLEMAGGILPTATLRNIQVQRLEAHEKRTMMSVDIPETQDNQAITKKLESFAIRDGDEVRIFPIAPYNQDAVFLQGHVLRPGRYSYRPGMKLTDLVPAFADLLPEPATKYAEIIRLNPPDYQPSVESFNLAAALTNPASAPELRPLDTVRVFGRYDFENAPTVYVGGEVRNPGLYRTSGEVHVRDAIHLAGGLTPDALLDDAQIFRYLPDSKLKIMSLNLKEAIGGNPIDNILLQPRDLLVIHRNPAKADPPSVYIKGEVDKPGRYPLTTNLRVADLIRLSGGFKRSADTESADLTHYLVEGQKQPAGEHLEVQIAAALAGDSKNDIPLRDGDVLTIRQIPGWNDIGATVSVRGEVQHPGSYAIQVGEKLSSVLKRAGGFLPSAYPRGLVFERADVRELQEKSRQELIQRLRKEAGSFNESLQQSAAEQAALQQAALEHRRRAIEALEQTPTTGRMVVRLRTNLAGFENSPDDIELRNGDSIFIPKRPEFVLVNGQVYNSNAITYRPGRNAAWYLRQAGGPTSQANKKDIFIVRANGSIASGKGEGWWSGNVLSTQIEPGDMIVVPEKAIGGSTVWKNLLSLAQIAQSGAIAALIVTR
jgi:protein involved in polysaccharide export with SLBB domain